MFKHKNVQHKLFILIKPTKDMSKLSLENIEGYIISINQYLDAVQKTAYTIDKLDDRRLTIINNSITSIKANLKIIKGATENL